MSPKFQHFHDLEASRYEEMKRDIEQRGVLIPILVDETGSVIDGHQRRRVCAELHIECPSVVVPGLSEDEKHAMAIVLNLYRRQLSGTERSKVIGELARMRLSTRRIGAILGVSHQTVGRALEREEREGAFERPESVVDSVGREQPAQKPDVVHMDHVGPEEPLADADGIPLPTGGEGREDEGGSDDAPATDGGAGSTTHDPAPSDPDAKNRAVLDSALVALSNARRDLGVERIRASATAEQRHRIEGALDLTRRWCDDLDAVLAGRPDLKVAK